MKFTKDQAYKELVAKMTAKGEKLNLSERSINEQLDTLIPLIATEESELSDFIEKCLPLFKTADANIRNDVSGGIKTYIDANPYKKVETEKVDTKGNKDKGDGIEVNAELLKRLEALEVELNTAKKEKQIANIRNDVFAKMKGKGVKNDEWINDFLAEIEITEDFDVDSKVDTYVKFYNKSQSKVNYDVSPEGANGGGQGNTYINSVIKSASEKIKSQEKKD